MELKEVFELIEYINDLRDDDYERFEDIVDGLFSRLSYIENKLDVIEYRLEDTAETNNSEEETLPLF